MKHNRKTWLTSLTLIGLGLSSCGGRTTSQTSSTSSIISVSEMSISSIPSSLSENAYTITWVNDDGAILEVDENVKEGTMPHYDGNTPSKTEDEQYVYTWEGWSPALYPANGDQTYRATYRATKVVFAITYILNGGINDPDNPSSYRIGAAVSIAPASKAGYAFEGWFAPDGKIVTEISAETTGDLTLEAHWNPNKNTLSVVSEDTAKGTVSIVSGEGYSGESIIVTATPSAAYQFDGWYQGETKVSNDSPYTFTMPSQDYSLVAKFSYDEARAQKYGIAPSFSKDGKTVTYGLYPQKNTVDEATLNELNKLLAPETNGYYFFEGEYYAKTVARPLSSTTKFDNGSLVKNGETYWFKCEPITWNILSNNGNEYYLLSSLIIDAHAFHNSQEMRVIDNYAVYGNNYQYSDIRAWLNGYDGSDYLVQDYTASQSFKSTAFGLGDDYIKTTLIDNSPSSTHSPANEWTCDDTEDKVFLPSYQDYINTDYGFSDSTDSSDTRRCNTTDWSRARGIYYSTKVYPKKGDYWTRSPERHRNDSYNSWSVSYMGAIGFCGVDYAAEGVRPSIYLKVS